MFIINKKKLIIYLNYLKFIIEKKNKDDLNFLLEKKKNKLNLIYNNKNLQIKIKIKFKDINEKDFKILILFDKFLKIIKNLSDKNIKFKRKNLNLIIIGKNTKFFINLIKFENYEKMSFFNIKSKILLNENNVKEIINNNYFIENKIENSNNGVFFKIKNNELITISNDEYRLSYYKINLNNINSYKKKFILPFKTILLLKKIIKRKFKNLEIKKFNNKIKLKIKNINIISYLIIKKFPYVKNIYIKNYEDKFKIERNKLKYILERSLSVIKNNYNCYNEWLLEKNILKIITNSNKEKLIDKIKFKFNIKSNFKIYLNTNYLLDLIKNIKSKFYEFKYLKKKKILIISIENKSYRYVTATLKI